MRRVLVTGGNGFIGSNLISGLSSLPELNVIATYRENQESLPREKGGAIHCVHLDVADINEVENIFSDYHFDAVIHTAAFIKDGNDIGVLKSCLEQNVLGTGNLIEASRGQGCELFIYCSSISVYGDIIGGEAVTKEISEDDRPSPNSYYGWSKLSAEELVRVSSESGSMRGISVRLAGTHGPGRKSGVFYTMMRNAHAGRPLKVMEPASRFRFLFVDDAVDALMKCLLLPIGGNYRCYNVAGDQIFTLADLANQIVTYTGSESRVEKTGGARVRNQVWSIDRIRTEMGFKPKPLRDHIMKMQEFINVSCLD